MYYKLLLISEVHCEKLIKLNKALEQKCPEVVNRKNKIFPHDNAKPHTTLLIRQKLLEFGSEMCYHIHYKFYKSYYVIEMLFTFRYKHIARNDPHKKMFAF